VINGSEKERERNKELARFQVIPHVNSSPFTHHLDPCDKDRLLLSLISNGLPSSHEVYRPFIYKAILSSVECWRRILFIEYIQFCRRMSSGWPGTNKGRAVQAACMRGFRSAVHQNHSRRVGIHNAVGVLQSHLRNWRCRGRDGVFAFVRGISFVAVGCDSAGWDSSRKSRQGYRSGSNGGYTPSSPSSCSCCVIYSF